MIVLVACVAVFFEGGLYWVPAAIAFLVLDGARTTAAPAATGTPRP